MNIQLHIERLVLDGVALDGAPPHLLQAAIQQELTRLLTAGGLSPALAAGVALPRMTAPALSLPAGGVAELGGRIAASVYGGIGR